MNPLTAHYISHVESSITAAEAHQSKLLPFHLNLDGMSSHKVRHLFNNILGVRAAEDRPTRYLEVGTWKGSTLCAALFNNGIDAVAIDNFSQFHGVSFTGAHKVDPRSALQYHVHETMRLASVQSHLNFIDGDAFAIDPATLGGLFDVYFYDGEHTGPAQKRAFTHFGPALQSTFITLVDDYHDENTQTATQEGLWEAGCTVVKDWHLERLGGDLTQLAAGWWNGVYVAVCQRN